MRQTAERRLAGMLRRDGCIDFSPEDLDDPEYNAADTRKDTNGNLTSVV